jgi:predicted anti-sigma-YlaC factor YlaD
MNMSSHTQTIPDGELSCKDVYDFLSAYLEGEVTPAQRVLFEEHLAECESCVRYIAQYKQTIRMGREAFESTHGPAGDPANAGIPPGLVEAIRDTLRREARKPT